ncbi:MAG: RNA polymerase sigma-54 factor [Anaerolineales bacterium]
MMFQVQTQNLRPLTTAHLAQTMTLLHMNAQELAQKIEGELSQNPALELVEERRCPMCRRRLIDAGPCPICSRPNSVSNEEPIVFVSSRDDFFQNSGSGLSSRAFTDDELPDDNLSAAVDDLPTSVLHQIAAEIEPADRLLAAYILTSLDEDGLLPISVLEISRYHHVSISRVEALLNLIRRADPVGVGSTSVQEALLTQIEVLAETQTIPPLAEQAIREGFDLLSRRQYAELAKKLKVSTAKVEEIAQFIGANLNPYPARSHWGNHRQGNDALPDVYHHPDILIHPLDSRPESPLVIEIISPIRGMLRVNSLFQQAFKDAPKEKIEKWKADLEQANLLIKCIQQRSNTMQRMMQFLAIHQRGFILNGDQHLQPMTRAKVADELGVHESTISRAVSGKTVQLANGRIVSLGIFFDRSLHIRAVIRQMVKNEKEILTDTQIVSMLAKNGYRIARRTVAKYRAMEGILPAHLRRNIARTF